MKMHVNNQQNQRGQSLVEFALTLIIILTLLAGTVDLGSAFFSWVAIRDAAQEGALFGSVEAVVDNNPYNSKYDPGEALNTGAIETRVRHSSDHPVDLTDTTKVDVDIVISDPPCVGGWVRVTVTYTYQLTMPLIGVIIGTQTIPVTASVTNTILKPACP